MDATATGQIVVLNAVIDIIFESAIVALIIALVFTAGFLILVYHFLERRASLGFANIVPIAVAVVFLAGTMPALGIPLNALTATILSIAVGIGIAYTVHITHRFIDEYNQTEDTIESLSTTLRGTGGALTGSMLTTAGGTGALALAITPCTRTVRSADGNKRRLLLRGVDARPSADACCLGEVLRIDRCRSQPPSYSSICER